MSLLQKKSYSRGMDKVRAPFKYVIQLITLDIYPHDLEVLQCNEFLREGLIDYWIQYAPYVILLPLLTQ